MTDKIQIKTALISTFKKEGLLPVLEVLAKNNIKIISTGGTKKFIEENGFTAKDVEEYTGYPAIFGGRVKTLHPAIFGGILHRRNNENDAKEKAKHRIPAIDLVIVDLYPFKETVKATHNEAEIIEKIDIGGVSLLRAAAKNYADVLVCSNQIQYHALTQLLESENGSTSKMDRHNFATKAFLETAAYDTQIFNYFSDKSTETIPAFFAGEVGAMPLRYGENPHQDGRFFGNFKDVATQLHGKSISYNNLVDIEAAIALINDFDSPSFAILKHNNACGLACRENVKQAYADALAGDSVSAFGGVLISNSPVTIEAAEDINQLFFEVLIAPAYENAALYLLKSKKNRILLQLKSFAFPDRQYRQLLNGVLVQERDRQVQSKADIKIVTNEKPANAAIDNLLFANTIVKHTKSNAIVLANNKQLLGIGTGHTSRVDALKHAINKAKEAELSLNGAVMASDAFFPFPDCAEIAHNAGIKNIIQPGGSMRDSLTIDFCNQHKMGMVFTGVRHFKH